MSDRHATEFPARTVDMARPKNNVCSNRQPREVVLGNELLVVPPFFLQPPLPPPARDHPNSLHHPRGSYQPHLPRPRHRSTPLPHLLRGVQIPLLPLPNNLECHGAPLRPLARHQRMVGTPPRTPIECAFQPTLRFGSGTCPFSRPREASSRAREKAETCYPRA